MPEWLPDKSFGILGIVFSSILWKLGGGKANLSFTLWVPLNEKDHTKI